MGAGYRRQAQDRAEKFDTFRDSVNRSLDGVEDRKVNIGVQFKAGTKFYYDAAHQGIATGGFVRKFADGGTMPGYTPHRRAPLLQSDRRLALPFWRRARAEARGWAGPRHRLG